MSSSVGVKDIFSWPQYFVMKQSTPLPLDQINYPVNIDINEKVSLFIGDITQLKVDAIVNAANKTLLGGSGVDRAIHCAAGRELLKECQTLNGCETGDAKITKGYKLPAKHVIHTVGPRGENKEKLKSCYNKCLELMLENNLKSIAFPCISTGIYGYPQAEAARVALSTTREFLEKHYKSVDRIIFCLFLQSDIEIYEDFMLEYYPV